MWFVSGCADAVNIARALDCGEAYLFLGWEVLAAL